MITRMLNLEHFQVVGARGPEVRSQNGSARRWIGMRRLLVLLPFALACAPGTNAGTSPSRIAPPAEASDAATV